MICALNEFTAGEAVLLGCCQLAENAGTDLPKELACSKTRSPIWVMATYSTAMKIRYAKARAGVRVRLVGSKRSITLTRGASRYANNSATMNTNRVVRIWYTSHSNSKT